jgi:hypothetical protein
MNSVGVVADAIKELHQPVLDLGSANNMQFLYDFQVKRAWVLPSGNLVLSSVPPGGLCPFDTHLQLTGSFNSAPSPLPNMRRLRSFDARKRPVCLFYTKSYRRIIDPLSPQRGQGRRPGRRQSFGMP